MMKKNNNVLIVTGAVIVLVVGLGLGVFFLTTHNNKSNAGDANTAANNGTAGMDISNDSDTLDDTGAQKKDDGTDKTGTNQATASSQFGDGLFLVNSNIMPGKYNSDGSGDCNWQRMNALSGYRNVTASGKTHGPTSVEIFSSDKAFKSNGCGTWRLQS